MAKAKSAKKTSGMAPELLAKYEKLVATQPGVERKGASMPYTSMNGNMFSFLTKEGKLALRLSAEEREAFLKKYGTQLVVQHNTVMKEYVEVPDALWEKAAALKKHFAVSVEYARSLKPKPTARKKSTKKKAAGKKPTKKNKK